MKDVLYTLEKSTSLPAVSIIMSTDLASFADKEKIVIRLKQSINQVKKEMLEKFDAATVETIVDNLNELLETIDYRHLGKGVGLFASSDLAKRVDFPFAVDSRNIVTEGFITSDIRKNMSMFFQYEVLILSRKESRLFKGIGDHLTEIKEGFPIPFADEFQINRADPHSYYNNEESKINDSRRVTYFRKIAEAVNSRENKVPLVLIGTVENTSDFKNTNKCKRSIVVEINGNMDKKRLSEIIASVWTEVAPFAKEQSKEYSN